MKVASSEFRKHLFQYITQALDGTVVEIEYKGQYLRLVPENKPSIMSRLITRNTINGTPEDLEVAQRELGEEMLASFDSKWERKGL